MDPTATNVVELLEQLDDEIDDLEESLAPILKAGLADTANKLPLLDKAKLYVLVTYAIESMLFSYLRLHGVNAREHPVFIELTRVKQYFNKIKVAENPPSTQSGVTLDKGAAGRFIRAGLSGNDKLDLERAERVAKEKAKINIKFDEPESAPKKASKPSAARTSSDSSESSAEEEEEPKQEKPAARIKTATEKAKQRKLDMLAARSASQSKEGTPTSQASSSGQRKKKKSDKRKAARKARKFEKRSSE